MVVLSGATVKTNRRPEASTAAASRFDPVQGVVDAADRLAPARDVGAEVQPAVVPWMTLGYSTPSPLSATVPSPEGTPATGPGSALPYEGGSPKTRSDPAA